MDLVLFSFAVEHLLIISRIIKQPTENAFFTKTYGKIEWKKDLKRF